MAFTSFNSFNSRGAAPTAFGGGFNSAPTAFAGGFNSAPTAFAGGFNSRGVAAPQAAFSSVAGGAYGQTYGAPVTTMGNSFGNVVNATAAPVTTMAAPMQMRAAPVTTMAAAPVAFASQGARVVETFAPGGAFVEEFVRPGTMMAAAPVAFASRGGQVVETIGAGGQVFVEEFARPMVAERNLLSRGNVVSERVAERNLLAMGNVISERVISIEELESRDRYACTEAVNVGIVAPRAVYETAQVMYETAQPQVVYETFAPQVEYVQQGGMVQTMVGY